MRKRHFFIFLIFIFFIFMMLNCGGGSDGGPGGDTSAPSMPTELVASAAGPGSIALSWNASTDNISVAGYRIYRGGTQAAISTNNSYTDTGLASNTTYTYTVAAYDAAGNNSAQSASASATTQAEAPPPLQGTPAATVPDTGQIASYTDTFGEDSDYTINPPSYTDNGDGTITDNITGLVWQKQGDATQYNWDEANVFCSSMTGSLPGPGWRLPTRAELLSIVTYSTYNPSAETAYFPGTQSGFYWSSSTFVNTPANAWSIRLSDGSSFYSFGKTNSYHARCVRGQSILAAYTDNGDGTITDTMTGLMWQQQGDASGALTWIDALSYCENLTLASHEDWRLPNARELNFLVDDSRFDMAIDPVFTGIQSGSYNYWTSTTDASNAEKAWFAYFYTGYSTYYAKTSSNFALCVRGGLVL